MVTYPTPTPTDEAYIPTRDRSLVGAWIAVDDATVDNGCLWIHRGSHKPGVLYPMALHDDPRFDPAGEAHSFPWEAEGGDAVELPAGSVVFFNGYTLHRSLPNTSPSFRRAFVVHAMSAESLLPWDCDGTTDPTPDNRGALPHPSTSTCTSAAFVSRLCVRACVCGPCARADVLLLAGEDPYADQGYRTDITRPFVRPDVGDVVGDATRGAAAVVSR